VSALTADRIRDHATRLRCFPVCQGAGSSIFDGVPVLGAVKVVPRVGG
jgi:hypothetical protein